MGFGVILLQLINGDDLSIMGKAHLMVNRRCNKENFKDGKFS